VLVWTDGAALGIDVGMEVGRSVWTDGAALGIDVGSPVSITVGLLV
jgi:hypothetical protein